MVAPRSFGFDAETAKTNSFQNQVSLSPDEIIVRAHVEFDDMVAGLRDCGMTVEVFDDVDGQNPNAVFPNNWLSTWPDGHIYLYPMATESRRKERNRRAIAKLKKQFEVGGVSDISAIELQGKYLESTGVIIFDHVQKTMYGCVSDRCDEGLFNEHAKTLGYQPILFHAFDTSGMPIYHTNVMMGIQTSTAVICAESILDKAERDLVLRQLKLSGHWVIEITYDQMTAFCGNVLELRNENDEHFLVMSQSAYDSFTITQRRLLSKDKTLLPFAVPTIEMIGGGSVRCMLAEVFLRRISGQKMP